MKTTKINTNLHYANLMEDEDIPMYSFDDLTTLLGFVLAEASYEVVHLICIDENVFATHDIAQIGRFIKSYKNFLKDGVDIFWQEYDSYESAYRVALSMQETNAFCYKDSTN